MDHQFEVNDIIQVQSTVADLEFVGLLGYVSAVTETTVNVAFYHNEVKGENAYCIEQDFLKSEVFFVGRPNPDLLPV